MGSTKTESGMQKIDPVKVWILHRGGMSVVEIARKLGVTHQAVSVALKRLKRDTGKSLALPDDTHVPRLLENTIDAIGQLNKINEVANRLLEQLTDEQAYMDKVVNLIRVGMDGDLSDKQIKDKISGTLRMIMADRANALKACGEIRAQLQLQLQMFQALYDVKAVEEFQHEVLEVIGGVSSSVRDEILRRLGKKRAIRSVLKFT